MIRVSERNLKTESKKDSYICEIHKGFSPDASEKVLPGTLLVT